MVEEDKTYENEVSKPKEEPNHGGKRPGAGRPLGANTTKRCKYMDNIANKYHKSP